MQQPLSPMLVSYPDPSINAVQHAAMSIWSAFAASHPTGQVAVYIDKAYYVSGELITGRVMADIIQPITCRSVLCQIDGFEKVEWNVQRTETVSRGEGENQHNETKYYIKRHRGHRSFFKARLQVFGNVGNLVTLMPGQYVWPFQYQLPDGLPGSYYERRELTNIQPDTVYEDDNTYNDDEFNDSDDEEGERRIPGQRYEYRRPELLAVVHYKIKALIDSNGNNIFSPHLYAKQPVIIHPRLNVQVQPAYGESTHDVVVCCCCNYGRCSIKARFDKNAYCPGETALIEADISNESSKDLPTHVKLWRTLQLKSGSGFAGQHQERVIVIQQQYEHVPPKNNVHRPMPLALPNMLRPTTIGQFVTCTYEYHVEANVSFGSDIRVSMPVLLYAPQPPPAHYETAILT